MFDNANILLVDDDPDIRALIATILSPMNANVIQASSVAEALTELSSDQPFDLAILDFWLGKQHAVSIMDSITATRPDLPIIMISGGNRTVDLEVTEAISKISGAVTFLQKPFQKATLIDAIASALRNN